MSGNKLEATFLKKQQQEVAGGRRVPTGPGMAVTAGSSKTKHMLIVSQGVHSTSCSLSLSLVAAHSQRAFSGAICQPASSMGGYVDSHVAHAANTPVRERAARWAPVSVAPAADGKRER